MAALLLAGVAGVGERRRIHRRDPDRVGLIPWPLLQMAALFAAALCAGLALGLL